MSRKILVFGGDGLLGSHLYLGLRHQHDLCLTFHREIPDELQGRFLGAQVIQNVAANDEMAISKVLARFRPDWVVNAIGLVKRDQAADPVASLEANTLFPHRLARLCGERSARLIHFSTDCVYSGAKGNYCEVDLPDCPTWHGRCKALGEPTGDHVLVLRTSFIGLELGCKRSLVEWFLAQQGRVPGYRKAIWSGLSAIEVSRVVGQLASRDDEISGVWHLAMPSVSKYWLLTEINNRLGDRGVELFADDSFVCDRSLDGSAFLARTGIVLPGWRQMLDELAGDIATRWNPTGPSYWPSYGD